MSIQARFIDFHNAIKLSKSDDAYAKARQKDDSITDAIKLAFKEAGYTVIDDFLVGSHSTDTAIISICGDSDIDRAIVIDAEDAPENPVEPKIVVNDVLVNRGFKNPKIKKPCVTADYVSENLHIDIPIFRIRNGCYELAIGKRNSDELNREWSPADPKGLKKWIKDNSSYGGSANSKQQQFNRVTRYNKRWRDHNFSEAVGKKIFSIGLTIMSKRCFSPVFDAEGQPNDLQALKDTISRILTYGFFVPHGGEQYKVEVALPVTPYRDIFYGSSLDTGTQFRNKLKNMESKLIDALAEEDEVKQCKILNKLFGSDFKVPDSTNSNSSKASKTTFTTAGAVGTSQGA